jgi:hypothetical protein
MNYRASTQDNNALKNAYLLNEIVQRIISYTTAKTIKPNWLQVEKAIYV